MILSRAETESQLGPQRHDYAMFSSFPLGREGARKEEEKVLELGTQVICNSQVHNQSSISLV